MAPRNVLVVVADEELGEALHRGLTETAGLRSVGIATSLADGVDMLRPGEPHTVLIAEVLPDAGVWNSVRAFRDLDPSVRVVVMTADPRIELVREARAAGASGLVTTSTPFDQIAAVLRLDVRGRLMIDADVVLQAANGHDVDTPDVDLRTTESTLTRRELEVLTLLGRGLDPTSIASELGLSVHTARGHVKRILAKLDAHSQLEAVIIAVQRGLIPQLGRV
jgi:DNA-binding NarL/FixJ family response regulator